MVIQRDKGNRHHDEAPDFGWGSLAPPYDVRHADPVGRDVRGVLSPSVCAACLANQFQGAPLACL